MSAPQSRHATIVASTVGLTFCCWNSIRPVFLQRHGQQREVFLHLQRNCWPLRLTLSIALTLRAPLQSVCAGTPLEGG